MTGSFRKPYPAYCGLNGQAKDKRTYNRAMRRHNRVKLQQGSELFRNKYEAGDRWGMAQDGTRHYAPYDKHRTSVMTYRNWYRWAKGK